MAGALRYYLRLYQMFVTTSIIEMMSFRVHYIMATTIQLIYVGTTIAGIKIIYRYVEHIGVWSEHEFLFFTSFILTVRLLHDAVMTRNYWEFSEYIVKGTLDFHLLKPAITPFSVFFRFVRPPMFFMVPVCFILLLYYAHALGFTLVQMAMLPIFVGISFALLASVSILLCCGMFWVYRGYGLNFIRLQCNEISTWPDFIFTGAVRNFFTFVFPLLLIGSAPTRFLLDHADHMLLLVMVCSLIANVILISLLWNKGVRQYESASS